MRAFLFPGQGSQYPFMDNQLYLFYQEFKNLFDKIALLSKINLVELIFNPSKEKEQQCIQNSQIIVFAISLSILEILKKNNITSPVYIGHSLGELSAYVASEILSLADGISIVSMRSKLMNQEQDKISGGMLACIDIPMTIIQELVTISQRIGKPVFIANINNYNQIVLSGEKKNLDLYIISLRKIFKKGRVIFLKVNGAFHTPLLEELSEKFLLYLNNFEFKKKNVTVFSNLTSKPIQKNADVSTIRYNLAKQICNPINWVKIIEKALQLGVKEFVELGPNSILKNIIQKINPKIPVLETHSITAIEKLLLHAK